MGNLGFSYQEMERVCFCHSLNPGCLSCFCWRTASSGRGICLMRPCRLQLIPLDCCQATMRKSPGSLPGGWPLALRHPLSQQTASQPGDMWGYPRGARPQPNCPVTTDSCRRQAEIKQAWHRSAKLPSAQSTHRCEQCKKNRWS